MPDIQHNHTFAVNESYVDCTDCVKTLAFIDDCTFSISDEDSKSLSEQLTVQYNRISEYMASNGLSINDDKLYLIVFTNKRKEEERNNVFVQVGPNKITPSKTEKLLLGQDLLSVLQ